MAKPKLAVIVGSVRQNRFADHPAQWIAEIARERGDFDVEVVDLKDHPLPFFAEPVSPAYGASKDENAQRWQKRVAQFDAYIFMVAEYNRGPTAVLKNALDYAYREWNNKPVSIRRLRRRRRCARGGATAPECGRAGNGAHSPWRAHPDPGLSRRTQGR